MEASLFVSKTGLDAQQTRMTTISNNLANVSTTGFKRDRAVFEDLLYQNIRQPGGTTGGDNQAPTGLMLGTGVRVVSTEKAHTQGSMMQTDNALDLALMGEGMFQILQPDGTLAYTRDGSLKLSNLRQLVTSSGEPLQPTITIPGCRVNFNGNDRTVQPHGNSEEVQVGEIQIARSQTMPVLTYRTNGIVRLGVGGTRRATPRCGKGSITARILSRQRECCRRDGQHD